MRWIAVVSLIALCGIFCSAATLTTRDGQIFDGDIHTIGQGDSEKVAIQPSGGGFSLQFPLSNIASVSYRAPISGVLSGGTLPGGWSVRDVGDTGVAGSADYKQGTFLLSGEGTAPDWHSESFHYVFQRMASEAELVTRLASMSASDPHAMAGLMVRSAPDASSSYALLDVNAAGQVEFRFKPNTTATTNVQTGSRAKPPCWLRLMVNNDVATGSQSRDGRKWEMVGRAVLPGIHNACIGMIVTSQKADELADASFDHVHLKQNGLRGDYYAGLQFNDLRLTRLDPNIDFNWGMAAPDVEMPVSNYTVRWTGLLEAPSSDLYTFRFAVSSWAKLWLNGRLILDSRSPTPQNGKVSLEAGQQYEIRVDFGKDIHSGVCQLLWSTENQPDEVVPTSAFLYRRDANEVADSGTPQARFIPLARGILLVDGSFLPGSVAAIKDGKVQFRYRNRTPMDLPLQQVARVIFQPLAAGMAARVSDKPGLLTRQGDFVEGECQGLDEHQLKLSSVVLGSATYDVSSQAAALVVRAPNPAKTNWVIHTTSGAVLRTSSFKLEAKDATVAEPLLGELSVPTLELIDIYVNESQQ